MMKPDYQQTLLKQIQSYQEPASLMEVCGTHTMAIARSGIKNLLPPRLRLLSGPGCPVCVTSQGDIDSLIDLARKPGIILATFGDMVRVPGTSSSLQEERSRGADVRVVYSPLDALNLARSYPQQEVVFVGIGFETTAPSVGIAVEMAEEEGLHNFSVLSLHKLVPPALDVIFSDPEIKVDALICPGHVAAVTGLEPYERVAAQYHKPAVVTGFETQDILEGVYMLLKQLKQGEARAQIQYRRVVKPEGNPVARAVIERVFTPEDARWRGLGMIPASGLRLKDKYAALDARVKFNIVPGEEIPIRGCSCGEVLSGKMDPVNCALFGRTCTPLQPVGPCMVSQEGACAASYRYAAWKGRK